LDDIFVSFLGILHIEINFPNYIKLKNKRRGWRFRNKIQQKYEYVK